MTLEQYLENITKRYKAGNATEHTFRGDLQQLIESLVPGIAATNEPKRQSCGAPDYILTKKDIPVGFIEAKDIGDKDLAGAKKTGNKEQFDRYKASLNNLLFTDYLDFHLYREGVFITSVALAEIQNGHIVPKPENFAAFTNLLKDFCTHIGQTIKSSKKLAEMMAGKARLLADVIANALTSDEANHENSTLKEQMNAFKEILIHDITPKGFADVYAQTIAYGMFAARLHDPTLPTFSRQEAAELIPKSNPFLRKLFGYIAGPDIDDRIKWIVDSLVEIFLACNVEEILKNYGKATKMEDPIIHFYETFLSEYDPKLRKARGVWYTPQPVVNFIVRAVDDILKTEFNLPQGLADTSKTTIKRRIETKATADSRSKLKEAFVEQEVHKVQILDPATGTGTFLAEVVKHIHKKFGGQQGIWSNYVEMHLLPRLNGFELLMASYAMAHLKLDLLLKDSGFKPTKEQRLRVYLTNSLEEHHPDTGTLFANWLSDEANQANHIKRDTPVMCVIGNPPYSVSSSNKSPWIEKLTADYKKDLNERNIQPLSDDYIKFIRFGQHFIDKNGEGILAYISNNSFLDGIIHRQMRKHLLESFDKIYILDLHGNAKKKETSPDGSIDQNVFDIMAGVSINIFVKTGEKPKKELGEIFQFDLYGKRESKYEVLTKNSFNSLNWNKINLQAPDYYYVSKDFEVFETYKPGFKVDELFQLMSSGIKTHRDNLVIDFEKNALVNRISKFYDKSKSDEEIAMDFSLKSNRDWDLNEARNKEKFRAEKLNLITYRPFDNRPIYFDSNLIDFGRENVMNHILKGTLAFVSFRQSRNNEQGTFLISKYLVGKDAISSLDTCSVFPLYLYSTNTAQQTTTETPERTPNLNPAIVKQIAANVGLVFTPEKEPTTSNEQPTTKFAPIDLLDYIYAVLHSPAYREKYKEFLKIDFPRVPYPTNPQTFWQLVKLGGELRQLHLLESPEVENYITQYPIDGSNVVGKIRFEEEKNSPPGQEGLGVVEKAAQEVKAPLLDRRGSGVVDLPELKVPESNNEQPATNNQTGRVYINETQFFQMVPKTAWNFYIGGYQPAQKWLKDRKDRKLQFDDILHYQQMIVALTETARIMQEIDKIAIETPEPETVGFEA